MYPQKPGVEKDSGRRDAVELEVGTVACIDHYCGAWRYCPCSGNVLRTPTVYHLRLYVTFTISILSELRRSPVDLPHLLVGIRRPIKGQRLSYHSAAILLPMLADLTPPIVAFSDSETCFVARGVGHRYPHLLEAIALSVCQGALHAAPRNAEPLKCIGAKVPRKRRLWRADNRGQWTLDTEQGMIASAAGT